jgi:hypothetical protein
LWVALPCHSKTLPPCHHLMILRLHRIRLTTHKDYPDLLVVLFSCLYMYPCLLDILTHLTMQSLGAIYRQTQTHGQCVCCVHCCVLCCVLSKT